MFYTESDIARFQKVSFLFINVSQDGRVFQITLNRPEKRNAFTPTMVKEIALALEYANSEPSIWCVAIRAEGPVFCAGMDLNVFHDNRLDSENPSLPLPQQEVNLGEAFNNLRKPSIAVVEGNVLAGGFLIISNCTFVLATENAEFSLPEVKRGLFPMQVMASLLEIMPKRKVLEMALLGKAYSARQALEMTLITHVAAPTQLETIFQTLIEELLSNSPFAIKKGLEACMEISALQAKDRYSYLLNKLREIRDSEDAKEGLEAFREKREPKWKNR